MLEQTSSDISFQKRLKMPFEEAVEATRTALQSEGFGVLTEIDVRETLKKKLDIDFRPYIILGACNPPLAHQALNADPEVGLLLPCNVIIYQEANESVVAAVDPVSMLGVLPIDHLKPIAREAQARLKRVIENLG